MGLIYSGYFRYGGGFLMSGMVFVYVLLLINSIFCFTIFFIVNINNWVLFFVSEAQI